MKSEDFFRGRKSNSVMMEELRILSLYQEVTKTQN
jgi:hypothetical protein